jgi:TonB family protein
MATPYKLTLGLLPEQKRDWRTFATSYGIEIVLILLLLFAGFFFPDEIHLRQRYTVTELVPTPDLQIKPPPLRKAPPRAIVAKLPPVAPVMTAKLFVPKDLRTRKKKEEEEKEPPKLEAKFTAPALQQASLPPRLVYTGSFGSSAAATVTAPVQQVQTGGFGDPNGLKGQGKEGAHLTATQVGSFDLPNGPGNGNGSGGAKGIKGTIASVGFGNGIAQGDGRNTNRATVQTAGFSAQELSHGVPKTVQVDGPVTSQVEVTYKPTPVYTEAARQLKLEGEVLLEVMFGANGQLHVNRVVRGLGHGLDENAIAAANKMRFKPALRSGVPADSTAIVHVVFQLAY